MLMTIKPWSALGPIADWHNPQTDPGGRWLSPSEMGEQAPSDLNNFFRCNMSNIAKHHCRIGKITLKTAA